jgi:creatinine amidohydrolase
MSRSLFTMTSPEVAAALADSSIAVLPFGSVEQHGPHLPTGTDTMAAKLLAQEVAERLDALFVAFAPYGLTPLHAGHPGTISLRRETFEALVIDVCEALVAMGADRLVFVNWHEGNIAALDATATDLQARHDHLQVVSAQACYVAQRLYADIGGELTHGGGLEALAVLAHDPELLRLDRAGDGNRSERAAALDAMRRDREVYGYVTDVTEIDAEGWHGDPGWATEARAGDFAATVAAEIVERVRSILELRA